VASRLLGSRSEEFSLWLFKRFKSKLFRSYQTADGTIWGNEQ
jgi:hypothetical protein